MKKKEFKCKYNKGSAVLEIYYKDKLLFQITEEAVRKLDTECRGFRISQSTIGAGH